MTTIEVRCPKCGSNQVQDMVSAKVKSSVISAEMQIAKGKHFSLSITIVDAIKA